MSRARGRAFRSLAAIAVAAIALSGCTFSSILGGGSESEVGPLPEPPSGSVESFGQQQPEWRDCYDNVKCADIYAPLDWKQPAGDTITLRLVKHEATGGDAKGTLFVNPGGPGASGATYVSAASPVSERVQRDYDVIGWDPRGVGMSTPIECLNAEEMDQYLFGAGSTNALETGSQEWIAAAVSDRRAFASACADNTGELLGHVSTAETVQDLDMMRAIVGDAQLNYFGISYGTYIGAQYAEAYPEKVGRMVLDGAIDPAATLNDVIFAQTIGFESSLAAYLNDCITRDECPFGGSVAEAKDAIGAQLAQLEEEPLRGSDGRLLTWSTMLTAILTPLYSEDSWTWLDELFETVAAGDADTALSLADFYFDREGGEYLTNSTEAFSAINCLDYETPVLDADAMAANAKSLEIVAPTIGPYQGYGEIACAEWPYPGNDDRGPVSASGADPILVVGTTGDPATPYTWAEALAEQLESGTLLTYLGEGHTAYGENACIDRFVDDYLVDGEVPSAQAHCR